MRQKLKLGVNYPALLLFDIFKAQCTQGLLTLLDNNFIYVLLIPLNCTDRLQPKVCVNKHAKDFCVTSLINHGIPKQISSQFQGDSEKAPIDMELSDVKPLGF